MPQSVVTLLKNADELRGLRDAFQSAKSRAKGAADKAEKAASKIGALGGIDGTVSTAGDLPPAGDHDGEFYYVVNEASYYTSDGSTWSQDGPNLLSDKDVGSISVERTGAVLDGVTNDTQALRDAVTSSIAQKIIVPEGTLKVESTVLVDHPTVIELAPGATIVGPGKGSSLDCFDVQSDFRVTGHGLVSGFRHGAITANLSSNAVVQFDGVDWADMRRSIDHRSAGAEIDQFICRGCGFDNIEKGVYLRDTFRKAIVTSNHFSNCGSEGARFGVNDYSRQDGFNRVVVTNNTFENIGTKGKSETHAVRAYGQNVVVGNNVIDQMISEAGDADVEAIYTKARRASITGNVIYNGGRASDLRAGGSIVMKGNLRSETTAPQGFARVVVGNEVFSDRSHDVNGILTFTDSTLVTANHVELNNGLPFGGLAKVSSESPPRLRIKVSENTAKVNKDTWGLFYDLVQGEGIDISNNDFYGFLGNAIGLETTGDVSKVSIKDNFCFAGTGGANNGIIIRFDNDPSHGSVFIEDNYVFGEDSNNEVTNMAKIIDNGGNGSFDLLIIKDNKTQFVRNPSPEYVQNVDDRADTLVEAFNRILDGSVFVPRKTKLQFGDPGLAGSLSVQATEDGFISNNSAQILAAKGGGSLPFSQDGALVLRGREGHGSIFLMSRAGEIVARTKGPSLQLEKVLRGKNGNRILKDRRIGSVTKPTDNTGGSVDNTLDAISGSGDDSAINNNFADLAAIVNALIDRLNENGHGLISGT